MFLSPCTMTLKKGEAPNILVTSASSVVRDDVTSLTLTGARSPPKDWRVLDTGRPMGNKGVNAKSSKVLNTVFNPHGFKLLL